MSNRPDLAPCPCCKQPAIGQFKPFCSQGCKDRDLLNWLGEGYRIPGRAAEADDHDSGLDSDG